MAATAGREMGQDEREGRSRAGTNLPKERSLQGKDDSQGQAVIGNHSLFYKTEAAVPGL